MGGKTLDQFNSRQQARNRKMKDIKNPLPEAREQESEDLIKKNVPPAHD